MKMTKTCLAILLLFPLATWADRINEAEALQKAQAFLQERGRSEVEPTSMRTATKGRKAPAANQTESDYYVFNIGSNDGFVIVSGDDRVETILGYADNGSLNEDAMPDGLRYLLDGYAEQMAWLDEHGVSEPAGTSGPYKAQRAIRTAIAPLIKTHWDQDAPYNNLCPVIDGTKTVTGCVATAMAQIMYYHQWPTGTTPAIPGYSTQANHKNEEAFTLTVSGFNATVEPTFDWKAMTTTYANNSTGNSADAVAKLMRYCGVSLRMMYGLSVSSAYNVSIAEALKAYFGYDGSTNYVKREHYSYQQWVNLIYDELANRRPIVLGGQSMGGGHSFICDGYDSDDYFHINWGWGGESDGYFRLSVLQPREQGIGGSSTLDGFSFSQDAIIGIQPSPSTGGELQSPPVRLSLERMQFDEAGSSATLTITRESANEAFTGINIYYRVCSYLFDTNIFDYAMQLTDANGLVIATLHEVEDKSMNFNKDYIHTLTDLSVVGDSQKLSDGTYYIKIVCRASDATAWQECYDGTQQQFTAVVSGNTMTITSPIVYGSGNLPTGVTLTVNGNYTQGYEQEVTASITGGATDYHGDVILGVDGTAVMGKVLDIPAGKTVDAHFSFIPTTAGSVKLSLYTGRNSQTGKVSGTQIGTDQTINISASDASNTQTLNIVPIIDNLSGGKLYGNALNVTARVTNPSSDNSYSSKLNCSLRVYANADDQDDEFIDAIVISKNIAIGKNKTTDVAFEYNGLEKGKFYCLRFTYYQGYEENGEKKKRLVQGLLTDRYEMAEGYFVYNADGTYDIQQKTNSISIGDDAVYVDFKGISSFNDIDIIPSTNPNCLYLLAKGASVPNGLTGKNVVIDGTATSITLIDGNDFYSPIDFTANSIRYERTFTLAAAGSSGWNTICLPFTVSTITCNNKTVDWFHSASETGKNFWLRAFTSDDNGTVAFDYTNNMVANTPYIIAVPGSNWGTEYQMTGPDHPVTFSGSNAHIAATKTASVSGNNYKFCGSTVTTSLTDGYVLNGSNFVKLKSTRSVPPFRAWFEAVNISSLSRTSLAIVDSEETGIRTMELANSNDLWYTLSGLRLDTKPTVKGIYIHNGKKEMIK